MIYRVFMKEFGKRLRQARKHADLTQEELGAKTGIAQSTISTAEREGDGSPDTAIFAKACGVDAYWLTTGEGEMIQASAWPFLTVTPAQYAALSEGQRQLVEAMAFNLVAREPPPKRAPPEYLQIAAKSA